MIPFDLKGNVPDIIDVEGHNPSLYRLGRLTQLKRVAEDLELEEEAYLIDLRIYDELAALGRNNA